MAKGFSIDDVLGDQSKVTRPAGSRMDIVMLPIEDIVDNPENAIYEIGDVSGLKDNIAKYGLRTPLEVTPAGNKYMLVAGHRRHTACLGLHNGGDARFDRLPCIIVNYDSRDEEVVALITSNATARELTDIEKIRQYEELNDKTVRAERKRQIREEGKLEDGAERIVVCSEVLADYERIGDHMLNIAQALTDHQEVPPAVDTTDVAHQC